MSKSPAYGTEAHLGFELVGFSLQTRLAASYVHGEGCHLWMQGPWLAYRQASHWDKHPLWRAANPERCGWKLGAGDVVLVVDSCQKSLL